MKTMYKVLGAILLNVLSPFAISNIIHTCTNDSVTLTTVSAVADPSDT